MKNLHLIKATTKVITGAILAFGALVILLHLDAEIERQGNMVTITEYEINDLQ